MVTDRGIIWLVGLPVDGSPFLEYITVGEVGDCSRGTQMLRSISD